MLDTSASAAAIGPHALARATVAATTSGRVAFVQPAESFLRLALRNLLLTLATGGIYYFWGRVEARKRLMSALRVDGVHSPIAATAVKASSRSWSRCWSPRRR